MGKSGKRLVASANEALSMVKAQAEIARLQAEVERLKFELAEALEGWHVEMPNAHTAWNDAIEAAAQCTGNLVIRAAIRALKRETDQPTAPVMREM